MAGIISNVDSDVQKLRKLKNEIEDVKKALKGINIKVDIDIAKGMEAQLKSLTIQYNEMVDNIAKAEAKILLSTKRINDASEKIIAAQERISKTAGINIQTGSTNSQGVNVAETVNIQAQAKAYEDLKVEINNILGTRDDNIKRMVEEMNAIRLINAEIKKITKSQGESTSLSSAQQKRLEQLNNSLLTHKAALSEVRQTLNNNVKLDNATTTSMNGLSQSLSRMRIAYRELTEEERNSPFGKELLTSINQADTKIKELDATIGNHQRNVGNYGKQWNGLSMSIQQVGRELPSLAYGPKVFFSAISNNLPILADEIKRARTEYESLKKSGQSATPVWKQIVSSLFSWQTALTVGITLLTLYGDKVVDWVAGLFKAKDVLSETYQSLENFQKKVGDTTGVIISTLERLSQGWKRLGNDIDAQKKYILDNKDAIDSMGVSVNNVAEAERLFNSNKDTFILGILQRAKAAATMELAAEEYKKAVQKMMEADAKSIEGVSFGDKFKSWFVKSATGEDMSGYLSNADLSPEAFAKDKEEKLRKEAESLFKSGTELVQRYAQFSEEERKTLESIGIKTTETMIEGSVEAIEAAISLKQQSLKKVTDLKEYKRIEAEIKVEQAKLRAITGEQLKPNNDAEKQLKQQEQLAEQLLSIRRKNQQEEINLMADGTEKKLRQIDLDYQKELDAIRKQEQEWVKSNNGKLTEDQSIQISLSYSQAESKYNKSISDVNKEDIDSMNRYLKDYGTFQQKKEAITKEYADKIAKATTDGDKLSLQKQMEDTLSSLDMDKLKQEINWELVFGDLSKASKISLEKVKNQLKDFQNSNEYKSMAVDQKKVVDEALNNIQTSLIDKGGLLGDLPEQLENLRISQEELAKAQEEYNNAIKNGTDAEQEAALKKRNNAEKKVQNAQVNVTKSADKTSQNLIILADTITQLGSSSEMSLSQIGGLASGVVDIFTEAGSKIGGIVGAAFSLLDAIDKQGLDGFVENVFSSVFNASRSVWDTITFGAFSKITGSGESDKNLEQDLEYLAQSNQDLKNSLDNLSEKMDKASVTDASDIYSVQKENILRQEANTREAMQRSGAAYSNGFLGFGGSHSSNDKINKGMSASEWRKVSDIVGKSVSSAGQFFQLSSEQMAKLAEEDTSLYSKIKDLANNGYKDAAQYMDEYITYYKQLEELENAYNEKLTNVSFDRVRDDFKNALLDMESDAEDFANNFEKMMQNAIMESLMTKKYDALIQKWYENFAKAMEGDGKIDKYEQSDLRDSWNDIVNQALAERNALKEAMGWESSSSSSQSSTSKGFQTMSQDTGEELNGRFTALQIAGEEIKNQNIKQTDLLSSINEKISLMDLTNENIPQLVANVPDFAGQTKEIATNSYQPQVNVIFPDVKIDVLTAEVSTLKGIVDEMRTFQIEKFTDVAEGVIKISKNAPVMNNKLDSINNSIKKAL
jgi:hypothetical protein